ncbi:MAG: amidohydrolase family protein [Candidatus Colwellbacteria bacterium]
MSLLIKEVQIVDGTGRPPYKADVLIQKNIISAIGSLKRRPAQKEIDGLGNYLTPGFIDINTDSDHYLTLITHPSQSGLTSQGVTTAIGGHCGASLAPLLYGTLESIRKWADPADINVNWHSTAEFLKTLDKLPLGVNFGTLTGHSTIRRALARENNRRLTNKELAIFERILKQALEEGSFGFSTGLGYVHGRSASAREIKSLVKIVAGEGGVYTTHLRSETEELLDSVKETIKIAKDTEAKTIISHLRPIKGYEAQYVEALQLLEKSSAKASVYFDTYPDTTSVRTIYTLLPPEAQKGNLEAMLEQIKNKKTADQIKKKWQKLNMRGMKVASAPHHPYLVGRTIEDADDLINLMIATGLRATVFNPDVNGDLLPEALAMSRAFIASSNSGQASGTFPKYLELAVKEGGVPIEQAVKKITSDAFSYFGIKRRGMVKEKNIADLVIIGKSDYKIRNAILGGKVVGEEETRGEVLRHKK